MRASSERPSVRNAIQIIMTLPATTVEAERSFSCMRRVRALAAAPQTPQLGGPTLPKGAPNCLEGPEVASIQKQSFAWRIALNRIFCAQILYISVLKFFAIVYFQTAS